EAGSRPAVTTLVSGRRAGERPSLLPSFMAIASAVPRRTLDAPLAPLLRHRPASSTLDLAGRSFSDAAGQGHSRERARRRGFGAAAHPERPDHESPRYGNRFGNGSRIRDPGG